MARAIRGIGRTSESQAVEFKRSGRFRLPRGGRRSTRPAKPSRRALSTSTRIPTSRFSSNGTAQSAVRQGVTLDVIGESESVAPLEGVALEEFKRAQKRQYDFDVDWTTVSSYVQRLQKQGV